MKTYDKMKKLIPFLSVLVGLLFINCSSTSTIIGDWERLGSKKVNYGLDKDEIRVTASEGRFSKVKLNFKDAPLNLRRFVIHFGNGEKQEVQTKKNFKRGQDTRVVDLKGGKRVIKKVVMWYDTKDRARQRATVVLWGKH